MGSFHFQRKHIKNNVFQNIYEVLSLRNFGQRSGELYFELIFGIDFFNLFIETLIVRISRLWL